MSKRTKFLLAIGVIATLVFALQIAAFATHYQATLEGSNFEIDNNANLVNDPNNSLIDWVDLADVDNPMGLEEDEWPELRARDLATGQNDNSYKGGVKEDTSCPDEVTGSIPNNKSDLRTFHVYEEPGTGDHPGFLNLAWSRVTDPSGTTLMDFEFNQADADDPAAQCAQGPNVVRQPGDLLIEYSIDQGGARASITVREWGGTAWGPAESLTTPRPECPDGLTSNDPPSGEDWGPCASGTINTSPITAANSDKIITAGQLNARTFGEAQVDLRYIFDSESCESFGTAMLKSRSSDSFTSQLKDFIAPIGISLQNCGSVIVEKVDDAGNPLPGATFQLFQDNEPLGGTEPGDEDKDAETGDLIPALDGDGNTLECTTELVDEDGDPETTDDQTATCTIENVFFGHYWLDETVVPDGHSKADGLPAAVNINSTTPVTFQDPFVNPRDTGSILVAKVDGNNEPLAGAEFALDTDGDPETTDDQTPIPAVEGQDGLFCVDGLFFGDYNVVETVSPDGYTPEDPVQEFNVSSASTCAERTPTEENPADPDLTFVNVRNPGAILITKTAKDVNAESGNSSPLAGVDFTVTDSQGAEVAGSPVTTDANGQACIGGLSVGETYTVTESGVPAGFELPDPAPFQDVTISDDATCATPASVPDTASFTNDPLSEITVSFRSLAQNANGEDRTAASIDCTGLTATPADATPNTTVLDDTSETFTNLPEGTYNCTVVIDP